MCSNEIGQIHSNSQQKPDGFLSMQYLWRFAMLRLIRTISQQLLQGWAT